MLKDPLNYCFVINKKKGEKTYWQCRNKMHGCRVTATSRNESLRLLAFSGEHNHPPRIVSQKKSRPRKRETRDRKSLVILPLS